jgi:predicted alpha/beta-hydrolase family hydrolase
LTCAVLAPGYGGTADQPLLRKVAARLEADGIATSRITF